jgi:hypothetical protein
MDTPRKGYSRSEWSALSIQERIRAMNDTLDTVEASPANIGNNGEEDGNGEDYSTTTGTALSASFSPVQSMLSEEDMPAVAGPVVIAKRSSVVDMWRKREEDGDSPKKTQVSHVPEAAARELWKNDSATAASPPNAPVDDKEDTSSQHEKSPAPSDVRNMWSQRVANSPVPVVPKKTVSAFARKSPVKLPLSLSEVPSDLTFMPPEEETKEFANAEDRKAASPKWAQRGLQRVRTPSPTPIPSEAAATAATEVQEFASPPKSDNKRVSVVDSWQKRKSPQRQQQQPRSFEEAPAVVASSVLSVPMPLAATVAASSAIAVPMSSPPTVSSSKAPSPVVTVPMPSPAASSRKAPSPSPMGRTSVADRWAKRMGKPSQASPQSSVVATPDKQSSESTHPATDEVVSESSMDPAPVVVPSSSPPVKSPSPADRWAKRLSERKLDTTESVEEQISSTGHPDETPAPSFAFKLKPVKGNKPSVMPEASAPSPSETPTEFVSKRGKVANRWPIPGNNVAKRWNPNTNPPESPTRALRSKSPDVDSIQQTHNQLDPPGTPPHFYSENIFKQADAAKDLPSEESGKDIPQSTESGTFAPPKPASLIQAWNNGHNDDTPKTRMPAKFSKSLKPPRRNNELPSPQIDAVVKEGASLPAFDSWGGKQGDIDSDASSNASRSDPARLKKKNLMRMAQKHVSQGIAHKLADSSFTNDDDSTHPGDLSAAGDSVDATEDREDQEQGEKVLATLLSSSKAARPKPKPSPGKKPNSPPPVVVSGKSPRSNKLVVETVMETISGTPNVDQQQPEDEDEDLTPRTKKVVESLRQKKKRLQLQRRKMKAGQSFDSATLASASASSFNSADTGYEQVTPGGATFEEKGISSPSSLPYRDAGPECNEDLLPIDENAEDFAARRNSENAFPSAYTPLHVSDSTSIRRGVLSPKSEGGQSDGGFSFYSAASSAHTGLSRHSSGSKNSSLANRAEKVVQERRQKWKARGSKEDQQRATDLARKVLNGPQNAVAQRMPGEDNYNYNAVSSSARRQHDNSLIMESSDARAQSKREGLSTRYNTSDRFIDTDPSYGGAFAQPEPFVGRDQNSFSTGESVDSSEFRSVGSGTTESEGEARAARRRAKKKATNYAKERVRAKLQPNNISDGVVSDQFVSESTANIEAFKSAYESVSLGQMAADLADEVSLSVKGGGFDFSKIAVDVNDSIRNYYGFQTSNPVHFDEAAEQDINTEDEDDPKDLGACAVIDDTKEHSIPMSKWDKQSMAPAGQPSFEGLATKTRKGVRAAYV